LPKKINNQRTLKGIFLKCFANTAKRFEAKRCEFEDDARDGNLEPIRKIQLHNKHSKIFARFAFNLSSISINLFSSLTKISPENLIYERDETFPALSGLKVECSIILFPSCSSPRN
jgi:hypothetical protein